MQRDLVGKEHPVAALSKQQHFGRVEGGSICCSCLMAKWARESSVQEPLKDQTFGNKVEEGFGGSTTAAATYRDSQGNPTALKKSYSMGSTVLSPNKQQQTDDKYLSSISCWLQNTEACSMKKDLRFQD